MPADVQISFRGMESSPSAEAQVRRRADELQQISDRVAECRVMLEGAHRHHRQGKIITCVSSWGCLAARSW